MDIKTWNTIFNKIDIERDRIADYWPMSQEMANYRAALNAFHAYCVQVNFKGHYPYTMVDHMETVNEYYKLLHPSERKRR